MGILSRLFGKNSPRGAEVDRPGEAAAVVDAVQHEPAPQVEAAADSLATALIEPQDAPFGDTGEQAQPPQPAPPLRSLSRYRTDPAFQNFQDRLNRPPGIGSSRTRRRPNLDLPPREPDR